VRRAKHGWDRASSHSASVTPSRPSDQSYLVCFFFAASININQSCEKCRHERNKDPFCENCGLRHVPEYEDDSFIEMTAKRILSSMREVCFTYFFMGISDRWLGLKKEGWAGEELSYLVGLFLMYGILVLYGFFMPGTPVFEVAPDTRVFAFAVMFYAAYRLLDVLSYELQIVFLDRHQDWVRHGGHLLSGGPTNNAPVHPSFGFHWLLCDSLSCHSESSRRERVHRSVCQVLGRSPLLQCGSCFIYRTQCGDSSLSLGTSHCNFRSAAEFGTVNNYLFDGCGVVRRFERNEAAAAQGTSQIFFSKSEHR